MSTIKTAQNLLYFSPSYFLFLEEFQGPFAAWAMKQITPSGSFRNRWGVLFLWGCLGVFQIVEKPAYE